MPPTSGAAPNVYAAYGLGLATEHDFPELRRTGRAPDYQVRWHCPAPFPPETRWSVLWRLPSGEPWALVARADGRFGVRFSRYVTVCASGESLDVARRGFASDATIRHLLLDQVLPLVLAARGELVLHASAVLLDRRLILLAGETGAGKSTLAARLSLGGASVLADDGVLLRDGGADIEAVPSYAGLRLFDDAATAVGFADAPAAPLAEYTTKRRYLPAGDTSSNPGACRLGAIYFLEPAAAGAEVHVSPLSRRDTAVAFLHHAYRADLSGRDGLREQLDRLAAWSGRIRAWRVRVPRRLDRVAEAAGALADHASREVAASAWPPGL